MKNPIKFKYRDGKKTGVFELFIVLEGVMFGHLRIKGERKKRDWFINPRESTEELQLINASRDSRG